MITQTLTASQLRGWLTDHGVRDANQRIRATAEAGRRGYVTVHNGRLHTVRRMAVGDHVYYTVETRPVRALVP
jgi:hypothetical protein